MKLLNFLLLAIISTSAFAQGDPAPYIKGQKQTGLGNQASTIIVPNKQSTKINAYQALIETGNDNILYNGGFEASSILDGWTVVTGSGTFNTSSLLLDGNKTLNISCGTVGGCEIVQDFSVSTQALLQNYPVNLSLRVATNSIDQYVKLCARKDGVNTTDCVQGQNGDLIIPSSLSGTTSTGISIFVPYSATPLNVRVDKAKLAFGALISDVSVATQMVDAGTMTIGAVTTAPTKGASITIDKVQFSQIGPYGRFIYSYKQTSAGSAGSGDYLWTLPNSQRFDSSKVTFYTGGSGTVELSSTYALGSITASVAVNSAVGIVVPYDATRFRIYTIRANSSNQAGYGFIGSGTFPLNGAASYTADFIAPIEGFTASVPVIFKKCDDQVNCSTKLNFTRSTTNVISNITPFGSTFNPTCTGTTTATCDLTSGKFTVAPVCWARRIGLYGLAIPASSTSTTSATFPLVDVSGSASNFDVRVECERQGQDYINAKVNQIVGSFKDYVRTPNTATGKVGFCSAKISATGVISDHLGGCFASCTNATTPVCTFTSNYWRSGSVPNCGHSINANAQVGSKATTTTTFQGLAIDFGNAAISGAREYFCHGEIQ